MKIDKHENIRCGWCGESSRLWEWDAETFSKCTNREMKRAFTSLTDSKAFIHKSNTFYICPKCSKWSRGSQLSIIETDNQTLLRLGREPVMSGVTRD